MYKPVPKKIKEVSCAERQRLINNNYYLYNQITRANYYL